MPGENPLVYTLMALAESHQELGESGITEEHVKGTFTDLVLGGMASTTNLIYALVNILLHNHNVNRLIKSELEQFQRTRRDSSGKVECGSDEDAARVRYPTLADRAVLPYTQATIYELLRYVSIAPFTVPHKVSVRSFTSILSCLFSGKGVALVMYSVAF